MSTDVDRWQRVRELFDSLAEASAQERAARLTSLRSEQPELADAVARLLATDETPFELLDGTASPRPGDLFGTYTIVRELARGGMAAVYIAEDTRHQREVVIKVLSKSASSTTSTERFLREVRTAAQLQHPNICPVYDSGDRDGVLWYAMPYVPGGTLRDRLRATAPLPLREVQRLVREIARALQYAHDNGIAHRDVKPENVLLAADGSVLVMDFGIARAFSPPVLGESDPSSASPLTQTGIVLGTPLYMSPEQLLAEPDVGAPADQYALALTAWEMLAGRHPFSEVTATGEVRHRRGPLPTLTGGRPFGSAIEPVLRRALSDLSEDRFPSVRAFADAFEQAIAAEHAPAATPDRTNRPAAARASRAVRWIPIAVASMIALGALAVWRFRDAPGADTVAGGVSPARRVVVLPFINQGVAADADFAIGVSDAVRGQLVRGSNLEVMARQTSMSFQADVAEPERIARRLDAQYIVTGTVQWSRDSQRVRVRPSIMEIRGGQAIVRWEEAITAGLADVFAVQDSIAQMVMLATNATLAPAAGGSLSAKRTSIDAYEAFLSGEAASQGLSAIDPASLRRAEAAYARATQLDSTYGVAWSRLAVVRGFLMSRLPTPLLRANTEQALAMALRLAPNEPSTPLAASLAARFIKGDRRAALAAAQDGLQRFPTDPILLAQSAILELSLGRPDSAFSLITRAERVDPRSVAVLWRKAHIQLWRRDPRGADLTIRRGLAIEPESLQLLQWLAYAAIAEGDVARAQRIVADAVSQSPVRPQDLIAYLSSPPWIAWTVAPSVHQGTFALRASDFASPADYHLARADHFWINGDRAAARASALDGLTALAVSRAQWDIRPMLLALAGDSAAVRGAVESGLQRTLSRYDTQFSPFQLFYYAYALGIAGVADDGRRLLSLMLSKPGPATPAWIRVDPHFASLR